MINCIIGSFIGTLIGLSAAIWYANFTFNSWKEKIDKLIEDANTFKVTFKHEL